MTTPPAPWTSTGRATTIALEAGSVLLLVVSMRTTYALAYGWFGSTWPAAASALAPLLFVTTILVVAHAKGWVQTRRARATVVASVLGLLFIVQSVQYGSARAQRDLTDAERRGLAIEGREIRHRTFRFALPYPGPEFRFNARIGEAAKQQEADMSNVMTWVLSDSIESRLIFVQAVKGLGGERETFARFTGGIRKSLDQGNATIEEDSLVWSDDRREYRAAARLSSQVQLHERCIPSPAGAPVLVACVTTLSDNASAMNFILEGLQFSR